MTTPEVVVRRPDMLGESPLWCVRRQRLYWVDIRAPALLSCAADGSDLRAWTLPEVVGSFAFRRDRDDFVLALKSGLHDFDPATGALSAIATPEAHRPRHRFNEGKCDPRGRFWAGTMNDEVREPTGALYRLDTGRRCTRLREAIAVPNSLAWSPDGRTMYFADTEARVIEAIDFDPDEGLLGASRPFVDLRADGGAGRPDGATVDADGCLWSAQVVTGQVVRYAPDGQRLQTWQLPVSKATSVAFGDADLRTVYITTARYRLGAAELAAQPLAGCVFALRAPAPGLAAVAFGA